MSTIWAPLSMSARVFTRRLSDRFMSMHCQIKCLLLRGGGTLTLTDDRLVSAPSELLLSLETEVEAGKIAATRSEAVLLSVVNSVIDATGGARVVDFVAFACKASCTVCCL